MHTHAHAHHTCTLKKEQRCFAGIRQLLCFCATSADDYRDWRAALAGKVEVAAVSESMRCADDGSHCRAFCSNFLCVSCADCRRHASGLTGGTRTNSFRRAGITRRRSTRGRNRTGCSRSLCRSRWRRTGAGRRGMRGPSRSGQSVLPATRSPSKSLTRSRSSARGPLGRSCWCGIMGVLAPLPLRALNLSVHRGIPGRVCESRSIE